MRYVYLKNYGKSDEAPSLDHETVLLAQQITACSVEQQGRPSLVSPEKLIGE